MSAALYLGNDLKRACERGAGRGCSLLVLEDGGKCDTHGERVGPAVLGFP